MTVYATDVVHYSKQKMWDLAIHEDGFFHLQFDDGYEIKTTWRQTLFCWYLWGFHREYPLLPILHNHHIDNDPITDASALDITERIMNLMDSIYPEVDRVVVMELAYVIENKMKVDFAVTPEIERYVRTFDHQTLVRLHRDPDITEALSELKNDRNSIKKTYFKIHDIILTKPELTGDETAEAMRAQELKVGQALQIVGFRGNTSEINQKIHSNMIPYGFSVGIKRLSLFGQLSRDAAKAHMATDDPVKRTEYYNREMQLVTYVIKEIAKVDCGSTMTIPWEVTADDLNGLIIGRFYLDENYKPVEITKRDRHLIGKVIKMRTMAYCNHRKDGVYCIHCMGALGDRILKKNIAGYVMTVAKNQVITQDVISTKHLLLSAIAELYRIDPYFKNFIDNLEDGLEVYLSHLLHDKRVIVGFQEADIMGLTFLNTFNDESDKTINDINLSGYSILDSFTVYVREGGSEEKYQPTTVPLKHGSYKPSLSLDMLRYIRDNGYTHSENGKEILVDLNKWDFDKPIFQLPDRHSSTLDMMEEIKRNLFGTDSTVAYRYKVDYDNPDMLYELLRDVSDLTNRKFKVNLGIIDVVVTALMGRDPKNGDYRSPKGYTGKFLVKYTEIMNGRSLSAKAAYERQFEMVESPTSYTHKIRPNHPADVHVTSLTSSIKVTKF